MLKTVSLNIKTDFHQSFIVQTFSQCNCEIKFQNISYSQKVYEYFRKVYVSMMSRQFNLQVNFTHQINRSNS